MTPPMAQIICVPTILRYPSLGTNFLQLLPAEKDVFLCRSNCGKKKSGTILIPLLLADLQLKRIWEPDLVRGLSVIHGLEDGLP